MKSLNYALVSSLCALVIGILLVVRPDIAVNYLIIAIGALFLIPGLVGMLSYFSVWKTKSFDKNQWYIPLVALGSIFLGVWLILSPSFFVEILMYVLGVLLVLGGIGQLANLIAARAFVPVPLGIELPFIVLGISSIVYALMDMVRLLRFHKKDKNVQDVTPIEETKE